MDFYKQDINNIILSLKTNINLGLNNKDIKARFKKYGYNSLPEQNKLNIFKIFFSQFTNPLILILLFAIAASFFIGEIKDCFAISFAILLNVIIGFIQEFKAEKTALNLKSFEVLYSYVLRNNKQVKIETKYLVPGDIIFVNSGQIVPADIRLINSNNLIVQEAILTGESVPVQKNTEIFTQDKNLGDITNMIFSGTSILSGKATGIVVATGLNTQLGKIANLILKTKTIKTPLQIQIKKLSIILGIIFIFISILIFIMGLLKGINIYNIAMTSIALAVASIPEGLIIALTVVMAIGMQRMLKRNALVRHLIAAETLGNVSVICTDKTGTLTKGHMQVTKIILQDTILDLNIKQEINSNNNFDNLLINIILNNDAIIDSKKINGNPTEVALLKLAQNFNFNTQEIIKKYNRLEEIPFDSTNKYMVTLNQFDNTQKIIIKGAPEKVFTFCNQNNLEYFTKEYENITKQGLRVIAVAEKTGDILNLKDNLNNLDLIGLIGITDPLRHEAKATIKELNRAGIKVVLVTGDHKDTALNIAKQVGINEQDVFARVEPINKIEIVKSWQNKGHSVAMIGDGVNDAPALKAAEIGVALGSGTSAAHQISDIVLLDDNLSSIDKAVKEGRTIFENIRKIIVYLLTDSFGVTILVAGALLFNLPIPITPLQILWINIMSDGLPYIGLTMEKPEKDIMLKKPRAKNEPIINKQMFIIIFFVGIFIDIFLFLLFNYLLKLNIDLKHVQTIIFTTLSINSLFYVFSLRSLNRSIFKINFFSNKYIIYSVIIGLIAQLLVIYLPVFQNIFNTTHLNFYEWQFILVFSFIKIIAIEITKLLFIKSKN